MLITFIIHLISHSLSRQEYPTKQEEIIPWMDKPCTKEIINIAKLPN